MDWKKTLNSEFQSYVFDNVRNKLVSAHCTVTSNVLTGGWKSQTMYIFNITSYCSAVLKSVTEMWLVDNFLQKRQSNLTLSDVLSAICIAIWCSELTEFEQGGFFIFPHLLWYGEWGLRKPIELIFVGKKIIFFAN